MAWAGSTDSSEPLLRPEMPELDSIRGLAILGVLFYHGFYWQVDLRTFPSWQSKILTAMWCGRLGVNLFFVLSGFLITGILLDSRARPDYYRRFYLRRARRILPAYAAILLVLAVLQYSPRFLALSAIYLSNLTPLFGVAIAYPVLWSLAVEEHFYFGWPAAVRHLSSTALLTACVAIVAASPLLRFVSFPHAQGFEFNDYTWNSADGLACGAAVAILLRMWNQDRRYLRGLVIACLAVALVLSPFAITSRQTAIGAAMQVVPWHAFFTAILGGFLLIGTTRWKSLVQFGILRFFGRISYGLYLVHLLAFDAFDRFVRWHGASGLIARFLVSAISAVLVAWFSREYFEERFLRRRAPVPATTAVSAPAATNPLGSATRIGPIAAPSEGPSRETRPEALPDS
jgi:peptidoglycan/LPS O-acetylase OafA/YrhL